MSVRIVALAVILQLTFGLRKNVDIDVASQIGAIEHGKRNTSAQAVQGSEFTQKSIRVSRATYEGDSVFQRFKLEDPAMAEMKSLGLLAEWKDLLVNIYTYKTTYLGMTHGIFGPPCPDWHQCTWAKQNTKGKELVAEFNKKVLESGKAPGWKLTFYSRCVVNADAGSASGREGLHYLTWRPETDTQFVERSTNVCETWDRACCCRPEPDQGKCEYAWSQGKCCKFKYGNIEKSKQEKPEHGGCKVKGWSLFSSEKSLEKVGDAQCTNGPEPPPPPAEFCQFVDNVQDELPNDDGVGTKFPKDCYPGSFGCSNPKPMSCPVF